MKQTQEQKTKDSNIQCGCDTQELRQTKFEKTWNCHHIYQDFKKMLQREPIDILHITTEAESHFQITQEALKYPVKLIICEKPITTSLTDAENMVKQSKETQTPILINHERR